MRKKRSANEVAALLKPGAAQLVWDVDLQILACA
jgi:hypothetical protein